MADRIAPAETIVGWRRTGDPGGIPPHDDIALFGILHRSMTVPDGDTRAEAIRERAGAVSASIPVG